MTNENVETSSIEVTGGLGFVGEPIGHQVTLAPPEPAKIFWPDGTEATAGELRDSVTAATTGYTKGKQAGAAEALEEQAGRTARLRRLIEACKEGWDLNGNAPDMQEYQDMLDLMDGHVVPRRWWDE